MCVCLSVCVSKPVSVPSCNSMLSVCVAKIKTQRKNSTEFKVQQRPKMLIENFRVRLKKSQELRRKQRCYNEIVFRFFLAKYY